MASKATSVVLFADDSFAVKRVLEAFKLLSDSYQTDKSEDFGSPLASSLLAVELVDDLVSEASQKSESKKRSLKKFRKASGADFSVPVKFNGANAVLHVNFITHEFSCVDINASETMFKYHVSHLLSVEQGAVENEFVITI